MFSLDEPAPSIGLTVAAVRALYQLDVMRVQPHAKRPPCATCGRAVVSHSYHATANGVICHNCLYGTPRVETVKEIAAKRRKIKRNRWDNYIRPVRYCACGKALGDARSKRCRACENERRGGNRPSPAETIGAAA